jgi:thioredoxin reductase
MKLRLTPLASGIVIAAIALVLLAPRSSYQPGDLLAAHEQLSADCNSCHRPWHGPSNAGCVNCHGEISDNPHSGFDVTQNDVGLMSGRNLKVSTSNELECLSCHTEHEGAAVNVGAMSAFACTWCHKHPAIDKVVAHTVPVMRREYFVRHLFKQPFNHYEHQLLINSHYPPIAGGFNCKTCHLVPTSQPGRQAPMSLKWSGCAGAGCHLTPQDSFMEMPESVGHAPLIIAYSIPIRHIKAVFVHSAGHLESSCERCHFKVADSRNPDDRASLAIMRCFDCHAHQPPSQPRANRAVVSFFSTTTPIQSQAFAAPISDPKSAPQSTSGSRTVISCGQCHLFHAYGVVPTLDFSTRAPNFPPNRERGFEFVAYVPHWPSERAALRLGPLGLRKIVFSPWWMGLLAIALIAFEFARYARGLPLKRLSHDAAPDVAPQRPREVPALDDTYQTSIRHLYIVGEAAGTASINLAMRSGRQVIEAIANELHHSSLPVRTDLYDVVIVGCGPAGLGATATAKVMGLKYATLEKLTPASTLRSYPRAKFVQATPIEIAEYGSFFLEGDNSREELIREWEKIIAKLGLAINDREEVVGVGREQDCLVVKSAQGKSYRTQCVVLAIGVRGNPRHMNLEGEVPGRVFYSLIEPGEFTGRKILVVGGGNAGAETVQALADPSLGNTIGYSFRSAVLTNVTPENANAIIELQKGKSVTLYPATALAEIRAQSVVLEPIKSTARQVDGPTALMKRVEIENDFIFAMIGAELPTAFLRAMGVRLVSKGRLYG